MVKKPKSASPGMMEIFDLIEPLGSFTATVKRKKLAQHGLTLLQARDAYAARADMIACLKKSGQHKWQDIFSHLTPFTITQHQHVYALADLFEMKSFIYHYQSMRAYAMLHDLQHYPLPDLTPVFTLLDPEKSGLPVFRLSPLFSPELLRLDRERQRCNLKLQKVRLSLLETAKEELGLPKLKESFCLSRDEQDLINKLSGSTHFVLSAQSVANLSYSLADSAESNAIKAEIAKLNDLIECEEEQIRGELSRELHQHRKLINMAVDTCSELAWDYMLADFTLKYGCCIPTLCESGDGIVISSARNLPLELSLQKQKRAYQSLDISLDHPINLITGPNMGGKSSLLRCVAQFAELARRAIPVPAQSAVMPIFDYVYCNYEQEDDNLSSFGKEVVAFSNALGQKGKGLFLLDEFARGTNPYEGEALATAVLDYLRTTPHFCLAATHYTKPAHLSGIKHYRIKGVDHFMGETNNLGFLLEDRLKALAAAMDYSLVEADPGSNPPLEAIRIAETLGLPAEIVEKAKEIKDE